MTKHLYTKLWVFKTAFHLVNVGSIVFKQSWPLKYTVEAVIEGAHTTSF